MRRFHFYTILATALLTAGTLRIAVAQEPGAQEQQKPAVAPAPELNSSARIDRLYESLKRQRDAAKARNTANQIRSALADSGSATINLLMTAATDAAEKKQNAAALDFFDRITILQPDFAEAWHRRAVLHMSMNDNRKAMSDINETLTLNPRSFDSLALLATILASSGRDKLAFDAIGRYLEIYPADKEAQKRMQELADKLDGNRS